MNLKNLLFLHLSEANNIGDDSSCPAHWLPQFAGCETMDIRNYEDSTHSHRDIIIGGGGLLHPGLRELVQGTLKSQPRGKRIIWGIGSNYHGPIADPYPAWLSEFDLVGLRDADGHSFKYVPCSSCLAVPDEMNPNPIFEYVIYEHKDIPINIPDTKFPKMRNDGRRKQLGEVFKFMRLGNSIITNSYHGAYWALLLRKPLIIWKPFSTRFHTFGIRGVDADESNWQTSAFVEYCGRRDFSVGANMMFLQQVQNLLA